MSSSNDVSPPPYAGTPKEEQPQRHPGMNVVPPAPHGPGQSLEGREWTYGLFDCFGDSVLRSSLLDRKKDQNVT